VCLIAKSTDGGQFAERNVAGEHEMACAIKASLDYIDVRRLAEASREGAREMRCAKTHHIAEIRDTDRLRQVLFDERFQSSNPPRRKSAQSDVHVRSTTTVEEALQKQRISDDVWRSCMVGRRPRRTEAFAKYISFADRASARKTASPLDLSCGFVDLPVTARLLIRPRRRVAMTPNLGR
jgi:hypothetical protein